MFDYNVFSSCHIDWRVSSERLVQMELHHVQKLVKQWGVSASCVEIMTPPQDLTRLSLAIHNAPFSKKMFHLQASPAYFSHVPTLPSVDDVWLSGGWRYCDVPFYFVNPLGLLKSHMDGTFLQQMLHASFAALFLLYLMSIFKSFVLTARNHHPMWFTEAGRR